MTGWRQPMLATLTERRFSDERWLFERKLDGVRALSFRDGETPQLWSRNEKRIDGSYPELVEALTSHGGDRFVADGEIVAFDGEQTSFARLQPRIHLTGATRIETTGVAVYYYLFDLLDFDGEDLTGLPLRERKRILRDAFDFRDPLRFSQHRNTDGEEYHREACERGWEGLIAKRADAPYRGGRSTDWLKFKCVRDQEFVVGGFTDPRRSRAGFGALLVGYHDGGGRLRYAGKVGTGYDNATPHSLRDRMDGMTRPASPFADPVREPRAHWIRPELVVQVGSPNGPATDGCAALGTPGCARTNQPRTSSERRVDAMTTRPATHTIHVADHDIDVTRPDKRFYPDDDVSKGDVIGYYQSVADVMLPHLAGRPLTLRRYPDGIGADGFFQKDASDHFPDWLHIAEVPQRGGEGTVSHVVCDDAATLLYLANQATIEFHIPLSTVDKLDHPDRLVVDIDPPADVPVSTLRVIARQVRNLFTELGLTPFVQATGGRGYHVVAPLDRSADFRFVRDLAADIADHLAARDPNLLTTAHRKDQRGDRIFLDINRNAYGQTYVTPYSLRARPGAPVATPLEWSELGRSTPNGHNLTAIPNRLKQKTDPWSTIDTHAAAPATVRDRLTRTGQ